MKTLLTLIALVGALTVLTGCQGFMGLDYDSAKYIASARGEAIAQCVAAQRKGLDSKMVINKKDGELNVYAEVEGLPVMSKGKPRRLLPNPRWFFGMRDMFVATKRGTPQELGLVTQSDEKRTKNLLLYVSENDRLVGHYYECLALYPSTEIQGDEAGNFWLAVCVDGKWYYETTRGGHLEHYDKEVAEGCTEQWRGTLKEYFALGEKDTRTQAEIEANRKEAHAFIAIIPPSYWLR